MKLTDEEKIMAYDPDGWGDYDLKILSDKMVNSRKEHECSHCAGPIKIGERHRYQSAVIDGELGTWRLCAACGEAAIKDYDENDCNHMEARIRLHDPDRITPAGRAALGEQS